MFLDFLLIFKACATFKRLYPRHIQGRRELGGGPGKIFLGAPFQKMFPEKFVFGQQQLPPPPRRQVIGEKVFPDENIVIAFQRLYLNFSYKISVLCQKTQISCPLRGNISPKKMTGAQQS